MAIEYLIVHDCPVKGKLDVDDMIDMLKKRRYAEHILKAEMQEGKTEEQAREVKITTHRYEGKGDQVTGETSLGEVLDSSAPLLEFAENCKDCPSALDGAFGCFGVINFPLSARSEQWLMGLAAQAMEKKNLGMMAVNFIIDEKLPGEPFVKMRPDPMYFESRKAAELVVGKGMFGKKTVTSDQLLQFLLPRDLSEGSHMRVMSFLSGGLRIQKEPPTDDTAESAFSQVGKDGSKNWFIFFLPPSEQDDPSIRQWKRYFRAVFRAHTNDDSVLLDY